MKKKTIIILAVIVVISILGAWYLYPKTYLLKDDLESGLGEWVADAHVPSDPNNPGHSVEWNITPVTEVSHSSQYSVKFFIDGRQDDGTIWIEKRINVKRNARIQVKVSFQFYSERESSANTIAVVCANIGIRNPEVEEDFEVFGSADEAAGWKKYAYTTIIYTDLSGEIWVAVGISVRWETYLTYYIDDIEIEIKENAI